MTGKQVIALLKENGWTLDRINGSHHVMTKSGRRSVPVPVHGSEDLGPLAMRILRQAGIEP
jgi:predicted RNA binding protein YcfA (HicA-like mRNA interferase family)